MNIGLILMASGSGRRFGSNKLTQAVDGVPLYLRALETYRRVPFAASVVVSRYPEILAAGAERGFSPLFNAHADEGISASIRRGLTEMEGMDGAAFAVCDQPWLTAESVRRLTAAFARSPGRIAALSWALRRGNPVIFPRALFGELSALTGDTGGGAVLRAHGDLLLLVEAGSARELMDVDAPGDLLV